MRYLEIYVIYIYNRLKMAILAKARKPQMRCKGWKLEQQHCCNSQNNNTITPVKEKCESKQARGQTKRQRFPKSLKYLRSSSTKSSTWITGLGLP